MRALRKAAAARHHQSKLLLLWMNMQRAASPNVTVLPELRCTFNEGNFQNSTGGLLGPTAQHSMILRLILSSPHSALNFATITLVWTLDSEANPGIFENLLTFWLRFINPGRV